MDDYLYFDISNRIGLVLLPEQSCQICYQGEEMGCHPFFSSGWVFGEGRKIHRHNPCGVVKRPNSCNSIGDSGHPGGSSFLL